MGGLIPLTDASRRPVHIPVITLSIILTNVVVFGLELSGGEAFFPSDPPRLQAACRDIAREIRTRYTLGYVPPVEIGKHSFRKIRVEAIAPGRDKLVVRTRTSYLS